MKNSFLRFFTGKMEKSVYVATVSVVVCLATVVGSVAIAHSQNKKIDTALESLAQAESTAETESVTESVSETDASNDKALQYISEYNKLTAEYKKKRAELSKEELAEPLYTKSKESVEMEKLDQGMSDEGYQQKKEELERKNAEYEARYKAECSSIAAVNEQVDKKIKQLDEQYEKDIAALKEKYGIS